MVDVGQDFRAPNLVDSLTYTGEIVHHNGVDYHIIDTENTDFSKAVQGRKAGSTICIHAKGGEYTGQVFGKTHETAWPYTAHEGDAIFVQGNLEQAFAFIKNGSLPEGDAEIDVYVPDNAKLSETGRLQFEKLEEEGYDIAETYEANFGSNAVWGVKVNSPSAPILPNANAVPACIRIEGKQDKFFAPGSMFKKHDGAVSGVNADAAHTWEIVKADGGIQPVSEFGNASLG